MLSQPAWDTRCWVILCFQLPHESIEKPPLRPPSRCATIQTPYPPGCALRRPARQPCVTSHAPRRLHPGLGGGICCGRLLWEQGLIGCATPAWIGGALATTYLLCLLLIYRCPAAGYLIFLWPLLLGAWRYQLQPLAACATPVDLSYYNGDDQQPAWATVEGWVAGYPDVRDTGTQYRLRVDRLTLAGQTRAVQGDLLVLAPTPPPLALRRPAAGDRCARGAADLRRLRL